jgi:hypothetical protein
LIKATQSKSLSISCKNKPKSIDDKSIINYSDEESEAIIRMATLNASNF